MFREIWIAIAVVIGSVAISLAEVTLTDGVVVRGLTLTPGGSEVLSLAVAAGTPQAFLYLFPCFGEVNWYAQAGFEPTPTNRSFGWAWQRNFAVAAGQVNVAGASTVYVLVTAPKTFGTYPLAAKYDFLALTNLTRYNEIVPSLSGKSPPSLSLNVDQLSLSMSWPVTGGPDDYYTVYQYGAAIPQADGYLEYSACGADEFMLRNSADSVHVTTDQASVTLTNIDTSRQMHALIVAARNTPTGYKTGYAPVNINGGAKDRLSAAAMLLMLLCLSTLHLLF